MLNMDYGGCYSRYSYELKPDRSLKRVKNKEYDPSKKPDPYPEGCPRSVRSTCMDCKHFAWCDPTDDEKYDPEPDTILMVESFIKEHSGEYKKRALWENLPRKSMYQTYSTIISYLQDSGKIAADSEGKICWIYNPGLVQRYINSPDLKLQ